MRNRIGILFIFSILVLVTNAQEVSFRASAPSTVIAGEPFQIVYQVNANGQSFRAPEFTNFEVLAGPFTSTSSSLQIANGQQKVSVSNTFTFTLLAHQAGSFTVGTASITVSGTKYSSNGLSFKVLPADEKPKQPSSQQQSSGQAAQSTVQNVSANDLFVRTVVSRTTVFEQEAIVLTYKLYLNPAIGLANCQEKKIPDFQGFMKQKIDLSPNRQFNYENIDGHNLATIELYKTILYPQKSGKITIEQANFDAVLRLENRRRQSRNIFDDFFSDPYIDVNKMITAPAVTVNVSALPAGKPSFFAGAVGQFSLNSSISAQNVKANEAITLKIVISGTGNMKMLTTPKIEFPAGFEVYDPKITNDFKTASSGVSGTKTIEYMAIPRQQGDYEIPAAAFSYFDTHSGGYKTLTIPAYRIKVEKSDGNQSAVVGGTYSNKEEIKQLGKDIRYINTSNFELKKSETMFFGTVTAWLLYLVPLFVALVLFFVFRKKAKENADLKMVRNRRANKVAVKRLKNAKQLLEQGKKDAFYEETLKSLWNYFGDKLTISAAELNRERVGELLVQKGAETAIINKINEILNTCESARYAQNSGQMEMGNLYEETVDLIGKMENTLK